VEAVRVLQMVDDSPAALDRLREVMAAHATADGVWFDSRAWLISAVK
jgi:hypothetical protein